MKTNNLSLKDVYQLVDATRRELNESIKTLDDKFTQLEAGRLSNLETKIANLEGRIFTAASLIAFTISGAIAIVGFFIKR